MKFTAEVGAHIRVPKAALDMDRVRQALLVRNKAAGAQRVFTNKEVPDHLMLYEEDGDFCVLPRGYEPPFIHEPEEWEQTVPGWDPEVWPPFLKELDPRRDQLNGWEALVNNPGDKMYCAGCNRGKTEMALKYAAYCGVPTLIVVDRVAIGRQWLQRICGSAEDEDALGRPSPFCRRSFDMKEEDIGWIQEGRFSIGKHFTIALAHTLSLRMLTLPLWLWDHFGLAVFDEVHVFPADFFRKLVSMLSGERLGLTATWERRDGLQAAYMMHMGGMTPCYANVAPLRSKHWIFKSIPRIVDTMSERLCYKHQRGGPMEKQPDGSFAQPSVGSVFMLHKYFKKASASQHWLDLIVRDIARFHGEGRQQLVLGVQVAQLAQLEEVLQGYGVNAGYVAAETKDRERERVFKECSVILATDRMADKALDIQRLDTMLVLVPHADEGRLRQQSDRIGRNTQGKHEPTMLVYCHDANPSLRSRARWMKENVAKIDPTAMVVEQEVQW